MYAILFTVPVLHLQNIIICDDWAAIRYATETVSNGKSVPGGVMEFVKFKD